MKNKFLNAIAWGVILVSLYSGSAMARGAGTYGKCGSSNGADLTTAPSSNLCAVGVASNVSGTGPWTWTCGGGQRGRTASCEAYLIVNGECGPANGETLSAPPISGLCTTGTATAVRVSGSSATWTCQSSQGGGSATCSATIGSSSSGGGSASTSGYVPPGYSLVFQDNFAAPNSNYWEYGQFWYGFPLDTCQQAWQPTALSWGANGLTMTMISIDPGSQYASVCPTSDSSLQAPSEGGAFTAAHMDGYPGGGYALGNGLYFEADIQAAVDTSGNPGGTLTAFWFLPESGAWPPEVDAPEIRGDDPTDIYYTNHYSSSNQQKQTVHGYGQPLYKGFHHYGALITSNTITWYLDGSSVGSTPLQNAENTIWFPIFDLYTGDCGDGWAGCPPQITGYSASVHVTNFVVYKHP